MIKFQLSTTALKLLYVLIWLSGGFVLLSKSFTLFIAANEIEPNQVKILIAVVIGLFIGVLKIAFIFRKSCQRNLNRIDQLTHPKIWQVFRPGFMLFLVLMIILGNTATNHALGKYTWLITIGIIDLSLAVGLLGSSYVFYQNQLFRLHQS